MATTVHSEIFRNTGNNMSKQNTVNIWQLSLVMTYWKWLPLSIQRMLNKGFSSTLKSVVIELAIILHDDGKQSVHRTKSAITTKLNIY